MINCRSLYNLILYLNFSHSSVNDSFFFFIPLAKEKALQVFEYARLKAAGEIEAEVRANKLKSQSITTKSS